MEDRFVTEIAKTGMSMDYLDLLSYDNVAEQWEEGEDGRKGGLAVNGPERHIVDFEAIGKVSDPRSSLECVGYDDDFVTTIDEFLAV